MKIRSAKSALCLILAAGILYTPLYLHRISAQEQTETENQQKYAALICDHHLPEEEQQLQKLYYASLIDQLTAQGILVAVGNETGLCSDFGQNPVLLKTLLEEDSMQTWNPDFIPEHLNIVCSTYNLPVFIAEQKDIEYYTSSYNADACDDSSVLILDKEQAENAALSVSAQIQETSSTVSEISSELPKQKTARYTVLVLDTSGSLDSEISYTQKQSAYAFCENLLADDSCSNYIALVGFDTQSNTICSFTQDLNKLYQKIFGMKTGNLSNIYEGLSTAASLFSSVETEEGAEKNIVLCTDGIPETGNLLWSGQYSEEEDISYPYANAVYSLGQELQESFQVYTIGSVSCLENSRVPFVRTFLSGLASDEQYYEASTPYFLSLAFEQISEQILLSDHTESKTSSSLCRMYAAVDKNALRVDDTALISISFSPASAEKVSFTSLNPEVLSVTANGTITAQKPGEGVILVESESGQNARISIKVYAKYDIRFLLGWV